MENQIDTAQCRERVIRALVLAQELAVLAEHPAACDHYPCALLDRVARDAASELRRAAARAGLKLAGERLLQIPAPLEPDKEERRSSQEAAHDVSSTTTE